MNTVIWKFILKQDTFNEIEMPTNAQILSCQVQKINPCLWVLVNPELEKEKRFFIMVGTGHNIPDGISENIKSHIGTFQLMEGTFVFHVFEVNKPNN